MKILESLKNEIEFKTGIDLSSKSRRRDNVYARSLYFKICKKVTRHSLASIGRSVNRDHATVLHGVRVFDNVVSVYERDLMDLYSELIKKYDKDEMREFTDPVDYWKEQLHDLENKYHDLLEEYNKIETLNAFMKATMKKGGYSHKFLDKPVKKFEEVK